MLSINQPELDSASVSNFKIVAHSLSSFVIPLKGVLAVQELPLLTLFITLVWVNIEFVLFGEVIHLEPG